MDIKLVLEEAPPLHPSWLAHEEALNLLAPKPLITDPAVNQKRYSDTCKAVNAELLAGRDKHLTAHIAISDMKFEAHPGSANTHYILIRKYLPTSSSPIAKDVVVYFHGGGLYVGDLDSEDLSCRRICKALNCTVYSCTYRKMPMFTADDALFDALRAFQEVANYKEEGKLVVMGSSSGGQLAGQISQHYRNLKSKVTDGVLLRGPVTCNATEGGNYLPDRFKNVHTSMSKTFHTSLLSGAALNNGNRTTAVLPLEAEDLSGMPRHWIQVSTNDIYYSDGVCYGEALREAGVEVKLDVVKGWPHTFWLKAPYLERAVQAENDMIEGLRWLLA
ncbi:alpha/beta-hydrolase [Stipitochalara longipes BDJ]|nr:alpha/beta-hydrolase [Stipitochalara longipes BDJ]